MDSERTTDEATFHSPLADFEEVTETVEVRRDPLTGHTARIADAAFTVAEDPDIEAVVSDDEGCFFCPDLVADATPTYADDLEADRGSRGEATSFPNLNPSAPPRTSSPSPRPTSSPSRRSPPTSSPTGSRYWADLVAAERGSDRWVGETAGVDWLAPVAPNHHRQVLGVLDGTGIPDPGGDTVRGLAEGLTNVLGAYADEGLNGFNFALHLPDDTAMGPVFAVIARSVFDEYYWSDSPYFTVLHDEGVVDAAPEAYAADVRDRF